jgi:hypothetical protein
MAAGPALQEPAPTAANVSAAIDRLASLDSYDVRMEAARTVRRAPAEVAVPLLVRAARGHADEYVRYKALVLLSGFAQPSTRDLMAGLLDDRNDRIRTVVAAWFEHHPDTAVLPRLIAALSGETSEFVRPALTRAVAAHGGDPRVPGSLAPLVLRGEDYFRGAVIEALGEYKGAYALKEIEAVARLDGPLQDDAITAIGRIGDKSRLPVLIEIQKSAAKQIQPTVSASMCLLGLNCDRHVKFVVDTLGFAAAAADSQELLRGAVHAAGMLAIAGREEALAAMWRAGASASPSAQAPVALGVGLVALRRPTLVVQTLARSDAREQAILLLRDAFDMLNEDFEEERFFVEVRRAFWAAPAGSAERDVAEVLIRVLEF